MNINPSAGFISPLTDYGFKRLFGSEPNKDLLIDFLNQLLPDKHQIIDLNYAPKEQFGISEFNRKAIYDIYCIGANGEHFIVELQKVRQNYFKDRTIFYSSFPIQSQAQKGKWDFKLLPVYMIAILGFRFKESESGRVIHSVQLRDQSCEVFYDKLAFLYIELPNFNKTVEQLETKLDKWLYLFRNLSELDNIPTNLQDYIFQKLFAEASIANYSSREQAIYQEALKYHRDLHNVTQTAHDEGMKKGIKKGHQEGVKQGREEGLKEGHAKGVKEGVKKAQYEIAKTLLQQGIEESLVLTSTGLSLEEIAELKATLE